MAFICGSRRGLGCAAARAPRFAAISRSIRLDAILLDILTRILFEFEPSCHPAETRPRFACLRFAVLGLDPRRGPFPGERPVDLCVPDLALQIRDIVRRDGDEFPAIPTQFTKQIDVVPSAMMVAQDDLPIFPFHEPSPGVACSRPARCAAAVPVFAFPWDTSHTTSWDFSARTDELGRHMRKLRSQSSARATRKPTVGCRYSGTFLLRCAERRFLAVSTQDPPRSTRARSLHLYSDPVPSWRTSM